MCEMQDRGPDLKCPIGVRALHGHPPVLGRGGSPPRAGEVAIYRLFRRGVTETGAREGACAFGIQVGSPAWSS